MRQVAVFILVFALAFGLSATSSFAQVCPATRDVPVLVQAGRWVRSQAQKFTSGSEHRATMKIVKKQGKHSAYSRRTVRAEINWGAAILLVLVFTGGALSVVGKAPIAERRVHGCLYVLIAVTIVYFFHDRPVSAKEYIIQQQYMADQTLFIERAMLEKQSVNDQLREALKRADVAEQLFIKADMALDSCQKGLDTAPYLEYVPKTYFQD